jgi:hypothetical protein
MTYSFSLPVVMLGLALLIGAAGVMAVVRTKAFQDFLIAFPRCRVGGIVMATLALLWAGWLIGKMQIGFLEAYKSWLLILTPATILLVVLYLDELLAARAFGGLLLMLPTVILDAARWHDSAWRYVPIVFAYALVVKGSFLVLAPYKFRRWSTVLTESESRCKTWGGALIGTAVVFAGLGLTVLR